MRARLLSFFSMSDVHITDKESPAQLPWFGWSAAFGAGGLFECAYSPIMLSTTHVLNAAVKTINGLHRQTPFDFGICLGDVANCDQFNELRWFIDVMDGQPITPSSGAHLGADTIDYQKPYQAAGLDRSIPWYEAIGNHDQFWMGIGFPTDKVRNTLVGSHVLNMAHQSIGPQCHRGDRHVHGRCRWNHPLRRRDQRRAGQTLRDAPDRRRRPEPPRPHDGCLCDRPFVHELHERILQYHIIPEGARIQAGQPPSNSACYTFEPMKNMPIKVIVLDDTCKLIGPSGGPCFTAAAGWTRPAMPGSPTNFRRVRTRASS